MKHVHHDLMIEFANDCNIVIEYDQGINGWTRTFYPEWHPDVSYRKKPKPALKPFDLAEALTGSRVVTHEGDEVTQLVQFESLSYPANIYGVVKGVVTCWNDDGSYNSNSNAKRLYMRELNK